MCAGRRLQQFFGAIEVLLRVNDGGLLHQQIGLLQIVVDGEQQIALFDLVALAHFQVFDTALLVGADEDQLGFDPALQLALIAIVAAGEREAGEHHRRHGGKFHSHNALLGANNNST